jgi:hypothetical protein
MVPRLWLASAWINVGGSHTYDIDKNLTYVSNSYQKDGGGGDDAD